jgi:hypothetical protein
MTLGFSPLGGIPLSGQEAPSTILTASIAVVETSDTTAITTGSCLASIAAVESSDLANIATLQALLVVIAATESSDVTTITANPNVGAVACTIAAVDRPDACAIATAMPMRPSRGPLKSLHPDTARIGITPILPADARIGNEVTLLELERIG